MSLIEYDNSWREDLKAGDIVFVSYADCVGKFIEITDRGLYRVETVKYTANFNKNYIRRATEKEVYGYQWQMNRKEELGKLKFRCFETDLFQEEKEVLRQAGYYVYDLRCWDDGAGGFNIEPHVCVNHIGCWVTDIDLLPYMNEGRWIGSDELELAQIEEIPYMEIEHLLKEGKELHHTSKKSKEV